MINCNSPKASFGYAARRRQGRFRDTSATVSRGGRSPSDGKGQRNAHLLALGHEEENLFPGIRGDGGAVESFSRRGLMWHRTSSSGDDPSSDGPTRNMASSQVACVNFLLPLAGIPGALAAVLRSIDRDVRTVVKIEHEDNSSGVEFEWIGLDGSLEGTTTRGANATSIDAFLIGETDSGRRRAYLIEWKYVEQYLSTRPAFKGSGTAGVTRRLRYGQLYRARSSSFDSEAAPRLEEFLYEPFYQIMRQRLLADRMVERQELHVDEAKVVVVVPGQNAEYRRVSDGLKTTSPPLANRFSDMETVESIMRVVLKNPNGQFDMVAPHSLVDAVCREYPAETASWAEYWRERYGV